jgi:RNA polymerase sigma-70 factor (ECF subfamily)
MTSPESDERFVALLLANQNRIFRFLVTLVPCRSDAEDLLQQTCLMLWQSREKFDPAAGEFASWACAIAHNQVRNFRRREVTRQQAHARLSEDVVESLMATRSEHGALLDEWHRALAHCLERLTPHQRALVEESYGGSSLKSAAAGAGRTPNALYKLLRHIRGVLHDCIQKTLREGGPA